MKSIVKEVAVKLAKLEGKKSQVKMGDAREVIGILSDLLYDDAISSLPETSRLYLALIKNGKRRARRK